MSHGLSRRGFLGGLLAALSGPAAVPRAPSAALSSADDRKGSATFVYDSDGRLVATYGRDEIWPTIAYDAIDGPYRSVKEIH
jgi:hypothetical protein